MPRSLDDDSRSRMEAAEQAVRDDERLQAKGLREKVRKAERNLTQYRTRWRARLTALIVGACSLLAGVGWTVAAWETPDRFIPVDIVCGTFAVLAALVPDFAGHRFRSVASGFVRCRCRVGRGGGVGRRG
jgi:hypothetical protein